MLEYAPHLKSFARRLRGDMTDAERKLWSHLRRKQLHGVQFYRQKPLGKYIVDFYAPAARLVVELDGGQHFTPEGLARDRVRDGWLRSAGLEVLRFDDRQALLETDVVIEVIWQAMTLRLR